MSVIQLWNRNLSNNSFFVQFQSTAIVKFHFSNFVFMLIMFFDLLEAINCEKLKWHRRDWFRTHGAELKFVFADREEGEKMWMRWILILNRNPSLEVKLHQYLKKHETLSSMHPISTHIPWRCNITCPQFHTLPQSILQFTIKCLSKCHPQMTRYIIMMLIYSLSNRTINKMGKLIKILLPKELWRTKVVQKHTMMNSIFQIIILLSIFHTKLCHSETAKKKHLMKFIVHGERKLIGKILWQFSLSVFT